MLAKTNNTQQSSELNYARAEKVITKCTPRVDTRENSSLTLLLSILLSANFLKISVSIDQSNARIGRGGRILKLDFLAAGGNDGVSPCQVHSPHN